jgi:hypothetical protein
MQQPPDQRRLPIVHAPAGKEAQQLLALVTVKVGVDVFDFGRLRHVQPSLPNAGAVITMCL